MTKIRLRQNVHSVPSECGVADGKFGLFGRPGKNEDASVRARRKDSRFVYV